MNWNDERLSTILRLEYEITRAVIAGHRSGEGDKYQEHRDLLNKLRREANVPSHAQQQAPQSNKAK